MKTCFLNVIKSYVRQEAARAAVNINTEIKDELKSFRICYFAVDFCIHYLRVVNKAFGYKQNKHLEYVLKLLRSNSTLYN